MKLSACCGLNKNIFSRTEYDSSGRKRNLTGLFIFIDIYINKNNNINNVDSKLIIFLLYNSQAILNPSCPAQIKMLASNL